MVVTGLCDAPDDQGPGLLEAALLLDAFSDAYALAIPPVVQQAIARPIAAIKFSSGPRRSNGTALTADVPSKLQGVGTQSDDRGRRSRVRDERESHCLHAGSHYPSYARIASIAPSISPK
jgi:hypothetical protein